MSEDARRGDASLSDAGTAAALAGLARIDFARHDLKGVLGQVAALARTALVPAGGQVSVTVLRGHSAYTAAFTGQPALSLDETSTRPDTGRAWTPPRPG